MSTVERSVPPLVAGDKLTTDEFLRRWEAMPGLKRAELIGGIVYLPSPWIKDYGGVDMPSPLSRDHGGSDFQLGTWLGVYAAHTPGCEGGHGVTQVMTEEDSPQPDVHLRVLPAYGGQSTDAGKYVGGAPELVAEISLSSTSYDLHQKYALYESAGVQEYLAVLLEEQEVRWHRLVGESYEVMSTDADGVLRSHVFPGLWLDPVAMLAGDLSRVLAVLNDGLATAEHRTFVDRLAARRASG